MKSSKGRGLEPVQNGFMAAQSDAAQDDGFEDAIERQDQQEQPDQSAEPADLTRSGKRIVDWPGKAFPVRCPKCGAVVLLDRSTRACVVTKTRSEAAGNVDRDMLCKFCAETFIARERSSRNMEL